jgi:hypothetical protein
VNAHCVDFLSDERPNLRADVCQFFDGDSALPHGFSRAPVKALDLVGKHDLLRRSSDQNFKRIIFDLRRERTTDQETCFVIITKPDSWQMLRIAAA